MVTIVSEKRTPFEPKHEPYVYPKGATAQGEPLPYVEDEKGKKMFVTSGKWTKKRLLRYAEWQERVTFVLKNILSPDLVLNSFARSLVLRKRPDAAIAGPLRLSDRPVLNEEEGEAASEMFAHMAALRDKLLSAVSLVDRPYAAIKLAARKPVTDRLAELGFVEAWDWGDP